MLGGAVALCAAADMAPRGTRAIATADAASPDFFLVRRGARVLGYVNDCPHAHTPLDLQPGRFLSRDGAYLLCRTHGARFDIDTGQCFRGPCVGAALTPVPLTVADGIVYLTADRVGGWCLAPRRGRAADLSG